jgi:UDP-N-acetylmuramate--alanine ligase
MRSIHFIGIGGVGMNGLAQLAALSGQSVTGSDRAYNPDAEVFQGLENVGVRIYPQDGSGITPETAQVVYSTAIESSNPDLQQSNHLGIPLLHRAEFLKQLIGSDELIAVAGTAGKTTTTGLLGWIFQCLEKDPSVYNGAAVLNWKTDCTSGNIRKGNANLWIIEADESDKSFLHFHPTHTIITNISKDHYALDELHRMFDQFRKQTSGVIVDGASLLHEGEQPNSFIFKDLEFTIPMLGKHNLGNALCAVRLCAELGLDLERVRDAVARFKGIERRMEVVGTVEDITVIDDYAHNPAKIAAALSAVSETTDRVLAYWRPHGFTPLLQGLDDFVEVFSSHWKIHGGSVFILPVYYAGGTVEKKTTSADFVARLNSAGAPAKLVPDYVGLKRELEKLAEPGDAILGMGARDPDLPLFAKSLVAEWKMTP